MVQQIQQFKLQSLLFQVNVQLYSDLQHYSSLEIGTRLQLPLYLDPVLKYILVTKSNKNMVK